MATVSGACVINKVSGLLQIREDTTPSKLIWKAIDQDKLLDVPLNNLSRLQASPETSPKMLLRLFYLVEGTSEIQDVKLSFNNRQTMTVVKEALQTIVTRQKTVIKDAATPAFGSATPQPGTPAPEASSGQPVPSRDALDFSTPESLSSAELLKNKALQEKLLREDRMLRSIFMESVIKFKLNPGVFWSSRINQLRTYALTISQHRGPYNVLSTIKPVATSENQVNVNVTRDTINEIFETYPVIRRAHNELVPKKLSEGEFWSRFFNSKLFRRLRGDKVNNSNTRGDVIIDKYLDDDPGSVEAENLNGSTHQFEDDKRVNKTIDLLGNEVDNSQKLGAAPDFTMKFSNQNDKKDNQLGRGEGGSDRKENEMIILMRNMNKLSSKMVSYTSGETPQSLHSKETLDEIERELVISDLNEAEDVGYVELNMDFESARYSLQSDQPVVPSSDSLTKEKTKSFLESNIFILSHGGIDLSDTYNKNTEEIHRASQDISALVKHNFRVYKLLHNLRDSLSSGPPLIPEDQIQELITFNMTLVEFLLHFWNLLFNLGNPGVIKKLFATLRTCQTSLTALHDKIKETIMSCEPISGNEKMREKLCKDLDNCLLPLTSGLSQAIKEYVTAARAAQESEVNENGKRPLPA
ncbi:hypothetical protein PUMCH_004369 [Australozyma saopauloensis]|uniref:BSD domain-containing protein n=1 Tax=Australozyma saopauloensis TaxID=291208 RepID=A0AAX4HF66_9ASCO|nr:hypothetical protein PUMCH_004369 [[Candida] saopauloensis]